MFMLETSKSDQGSRRTWSSYLWFRWGEKLEWSFAWRGDGSVGIPRWRNRGSEIRVQSSVWVHLHTRLDHLIRLDGHGSMIRDAGGTGTYRGICTFDVSSSAESFISSSFHDDNCISFTVPLLEGTSAQPSCSDITWIWGVILLIIERFSALSALGRLRVTFLILPSSRIMTSSLLVYQGSTSSTHCVFRAKSSSWSRIGQTKSSRRPTQHLRASYSSWT